MELSEYLDERYETVEQGLREFIDSKYEDEFLAMAAHYAVRKGKRLRGIMSLLCCEAMGGAVERGITAACAVELAHAASLVKDDIMDSDEMRRGEQSFWKRFGLNLGILVPDVIVPHSMLFLQEYGFRSLAVIADAWARTGQGQLMDMPKGKFPAVGEYQQIIGLKTAPLFEVSCDLGVRAARMDHHVNIARDYGFNCGMAFQVYDDLTDLLKAVGQRWEHSATGPLPNSMTALRQLLESGPTISEDDCRRVAGMAQQYLHRAVGAAESFPASEYQPLLAELPRYCCNALLAEVVVPEGFSVPVLQEFGVGGVAPAV